MNNITTNYKSDIYIGVKSEDLIINWFNKNNFKYEDKRNDINYRNMDIDFIVQFKKIIDNTSTCFIF